MSASLKVQQGFSLPEVLLSVVLMVMVITALAGGMNALLTGGQQLSQYRLLWRAASEQSNQFPPVLPTGWQQSRVQTSQQRCVSITVTVTTPMGRQGTLSRLHCPKS
ncbi:prepilin-type N-terminal cleavage/methylation domain-containing protein [Enterobacteriaceae bacterium 89]|jgi:prepilin peptidase dependent protein C|nr:prepilin-type N-terminal cleavage/methylation domain-containing protein [Enterobacteriaceae bacterium 89]